MNNIQLYNVDNLEVMAALPDESIDVICIDPPYLYLKNQKLERPFDEPKFFAECKRLLTKKGFIVMFGRGTSFYRWNTILDGLGFVFKEEVIWDKKRSTTPTLVLIKSIVEGANEESIMIEGLDAYRSSIHPTQKPVRLLERLLELVIPKDKPRNEIVVADFFAGSMSCMEAVHNMGMRGIATEIDQEYFEKGKQRIENLQPLLF